MIETGRVCGTSASSAPSVTTIWHAERLGEVEDRAGRTCASATTARCPAGARGRAARAGTRASKISTSGQVISRMPPSVRRTCGRVAWKSKNSSGSIVAKRDASSDVPTNCSAAEAASPASFQPLKAQTRAGARRPSGRRSPRRGCIRLTVHHESCDATCPTVSATSAPAEEVDGVFACTRKDRLMARAGTPYLALELRDRTGAVAGARVPRRRRPGRPLRARRPRARRRPRRALPRRAADRGRARSRAPTRRGRPGRRSCPAPTATSTSSTASSSTWPARSTTRASRRCSRGCWATRSCARPGAARRARAAAITPTSAGCSSTRSRSRRSRRRRARCTSGSTRTCCSTAALVHDIGKTREFTYGAEIGLSDEGRLLGHVRARPADARRARGRSRRSTTRGGSRSRTAC